jgi:hypothetical protein
MKRKLAVIALSLGLVGASAGVAIADPGGVGPNDNANCNAILTYINTHHPELLGSRPDVSHFFKQVADELGIPEGEIFKSFAQSSPPCL